MTENLPTILADADNLPALVRSNGLAGAERVREILALPIVMSEDGTLADPKAARMVLDAAISSVKLCVSIAEGGLKARETAALEEFLKRLAAEKLRE